MGKNVGTVDRILRIVVGAALIGYAVYEPSAYWGWIGVVPVLTALVGWCPAYRLIGVKTCSA
ncbi:MAG: DUF2892 domain-containing protein [Rhodomicrobium sp.]